MKLLLKTKKFYLFLILSVIVLGGLLIKFVFFREKEKAPEYFLNVNISDEKRLELERRRDENFKSLQPFPKNYPVYLDLGNIERELGNASKAIEYFTKAWEIIPTNSTPWLNIGNIYISLGFYEQAEEAFLKAIEINKSYWFTYYNLARLYDDYLTSKKNEVRAIYLEGLKNTDNDYQLLYFFTEYLVEAKNYTEALQYLEVLKSYLSAAEQQQVINKIEEVKQLMSNPAP